MVFVLPDKTFNSTPVCLTCLTVVNITFLKNSILILNVGIYYLLTTTIKVLKQVS